MVFLASRGATHSARIFEVTCVLLSNERRRTDVRQIMRGETISRVPISVAAISHGFVAGACLVISRIYSPVSFLRLLFWFVLPVRLSFYIEVAPHIPLQIEWSGIYNLIKPVVWVADTLYVFVYTDFVWIYSYIKKQKDGGNLLWNMFASLQRYLRDAKHPLTQDALFPGGASPDSQPGPSSYSSTPAAVSPMKVSINLNPWPQL